MSFLNIALKLVSYDDAVKSNSPDLGTANRNWVAQGLVMGKPLSYPFNLASGETATVFDGSRAIGFDGTTELALSLSLLASDRYRLTWTGVGTNPAFKVERAFGASGHTLTLAVNTNQTITVTGSGPTYAAAQVGDYVLIPGTTTGDTSGPFNSINEGYWTVIASNATSVTLDRIPGAASAGAFGQSVSVTSADQFIVFAPDRVVPGDQIEISGGFSMGSRRVFTVLSVSPRWIDFQSGISLAAETATAGAGGLAAYSAAKKVIWIESDQLTLLAYNGDTSGTHKISPLILPDGRQVAMDFRIGPAWKLTVTNKATVTSSGLVLAFP